MPIVAPFAGLVIGYSYLWRHEHRLGEDRPKTAVRRAETLPPPAPGARQPAWHTGVLSPGVQNRTLAGLN